MCAQPCLTLCDPMDCSPLAPLSMGFSRQEQKSRLPFPTPGGLPNPGIKLASPALAGGFFNTVPPGKLVDAVEVMLGTKQEKNCSRFHQ